ncbi:MAG: type II CRISPR-associated endonuclease Cas1 [Candidatus Gastranaerophilales bacterium]|nr:type II CRISPR-associated endonuclease Cas1 [Candidatus Gastranaerophilales bacterium]
MTYHILHITTPGCYLSVEKGFLFCEYKNGDINKMPFSDIRAVIVTVQGISFSNFCLATLLENNVVILHCNNSYQPTGWSVPLERIVRTKVFHNQIAQNTTFEKKLWKTIVKQKALNQATNLNLIGCEKHNLFNLINRPLMNEANIARQYWQNYFSIIGADVNREYRNAQSFENACLNYGYAVINTMIYRSIIIHGLIAGLGIHHIGKYKSTPLVYDLMEPYRAFVDYYFYNFLQDCPVEYELEDFKSWFKYFADCLKNYRIKISNLSYKIIDSIDIYIEKIADAYIKYDCSEIFLPDINLQYLHKDKHKNREYEE